MEQFRIYARVLEASGVVAKGLVERYACVALSLPPQMHQDMGMGMGIPKFV